MPQLIAPVGEARDDYAIFSGLAERLGVGETFTEGRAADEWLRILYKDYRAKAQQRDVDVPDLETLKEQNWVRLPIQNRANRR